MISSDWKSKFKNRLLPTALKIEANLGIPHLITITQAAHESNWGQSELTRLGCNLFGMTASPEWIQANKPVYRIKTKEYSKLPPGKIRYWNKVGDIAEKKEDGKGGSILMVYVDFRKYGNWDESVYDWANKIAFSKRYETAYKDAMKKTHDKFYEQIQQAGYATDPLYAKKLSEVYKVVKNIQEAGNENSKIV